MSSRLWKRKLPSREDKPLKEAGKTTERSLDPKTLQVLVKFLQARVFDSIDAPISQGKEAMVFRATKGDEAGETKSYVAVKVFKYETTSFRHMKIYIEGDPRFRVKHGLRPFIQQWAGKEYANLQAAYTAGVSVPEPIAHKQNVVVMEFLGEGGVQYALLEESVAEKPEKLLDEILKNTRQAYQTARLVHADLNAFNVVLTKDQKPVLIDWSQAVPLEHPLAQQFLEHDVDTLLNDFRKRGVVRDRQAVLDYIQKP